MTRSTPEIFIIFLFIITLLLNGCAAPPPAEPEPTPTAPEPTPTATPIPAERPPDFALEYYWEVGSLPPLYYYNYTITIGPEESGTIVFQAGYNGDEGPVWTSTFPLEDDLDALYDRLYQIGSFSKNWREMEDVPVGGCVDKMSVTAYGTQFKIPPFIDGKDQAREMNAVQEEIIALVPQEIWDDLYDRHDQYVAANEEVEETE